MFISQTAEYAIRAMSALAILPAGKKIRATDLGARDRNSNPLSLQDPAPIGARRPARFAKGGKAGGFRWLAPQTRFRSSRFLEAINAFPTDGRCAFGWGELRSTIPVPAPPLLEPTQQSSPKLGKRIEPGRSRRSGPNRSARRIVPRLRLISAAHLFKRKVAGDSPSNRSRHP